MSDFDGVRIRVGVPGLSGGGVSTEELGEAIANLAPSNATFITKTPSTGLSAEQALNQISSLPGIAKINADGSISKAVGTDLPAHNHTGVRFTMELPTTSGTATVAVPTGVKPESELGIPAHCTLVDYALVGTPVTGQTVGSAVVDILVASHTNYPPNSGNSIVGAGGKPTITSNVKNVTGGFTGWTTINLLQTDFIRLNVISCTNLSSLRLMLYLTRTV